MRRIAPLEELPEFYVECGWINMLTSVWALSLHGMNDLGAVSVEILSGWNEHRRTLSAYQSFNPEWEQIVRDGLAYIDDVISDWWLQIQGKTPKLPLDYERLEAVREWRRKLESIPGQQNKVWY